MDLFQLKCFVNVVDQRSFTKAAFEVSSSQSALSKQISKLEDELNVRLFDRSRRVVTLTPAGREFEPHARKLLADYDEMMASIKRFSNSGHLHIGSVDHMGRVGLTTPISTFLKQYPDGGVTIDIERGTSLGVMDQLVAGLKAIPGIRRVTMTTNGVLLAQQLPALLAAGLDSVNISLDTLSPEVFARITARDAFADVMAGIRAALESGLPVKLNCVPQVGVNEGELEALAALAETKFLQVRFIEMMPIGYGAAMPCISGPDLLARFRKRWPELALLSRQETAGIGDGPAVYYTAPGWQGSVGFIAAVHGKFCASCNRVRLTSQGFLRPCLASEAGCDLKTLLRSGASDEELLSAIRTTIWEKPQEHHFELKQDVPATRGMYRIGG